MPTRFAKRYFDDVPSHVVLTDPVGNEFDVVIIKQYGKVVLTGCLRIGKFYGLHLGDDFRMVYLGMGKFIMQVFNNYGDEVVYPPLITNLPVVPAGVNRVGNATDNAGGPSCLVGEDELDYYMLYGTKLTQQDMVKSHLVCLFNNIWLA